MVLGPERQVVIHLAARLIGTKSQKYRYEDMSAGSHPETGFDCSGFVTYVLSTCGINIPPHVDHAGNIRPTRHANELWDNYGIAVHQAHALPGDLLFFSRQGWWPTHVGIYTGSNTYIHSPGINDAMVCAATFEFDGTPIEGNANSEHRQLYQTNPIGFKALSIPNAVSYRIYQKPLD